MIVAEPRVEDEASPGVGDHPFDPKGEWWSLCKHCGLARAAHKTSTIDVRRAMFEDQMARYGEIRHAIPEQKAALEKEFRDERDFERERIHQGGRARIVVDDDDD